MTQVVLHHDDEDGFGSAYAIWCHDRYTMRQKDRLYIPVNYGQPVPELPEDTTSVVIVDFSYDRATCDMLAAKYPQFLVIDHHKTAKAELEGAPYAHFSMEHSGAVLTWHFFNPQLEIPLILHYVQDRDLWRWQLPNSEAVNLYISTLPRDFNVWDDFDKNKACLLGGAMKTYKDKLIEKIVKVAFTDEITTPDGQTHSMVTVNSPVLASDVGNELCKRFPEVDFASITTVTGPNKARVSLRSIGDFDVSAIAKQYGGGGHKNAAGFEI